MIQVKDGLSLSINVAIVIEPISNSPMSYKTIYVYFTTLSQAENTARMAAFVAKQFKAHLVGSHIMHEPVFPVYDLRALEALEPVIEQQRQIQRENTNSFINILATSAQDSQVDYHWQSDDRFYFEYGNVIYDRLRTADLVVVGQSETETIATGINIPARIALNSARPVLVVPKVLEYPTQAPFDRIVIAWNGKNEAVRATFDALPFLKIAKQVKLLTVNPDEDSDRSSKGMVQTLKRHGVLIESDQIVNQDISTTDILLSHCANFDADLLVLGCYGHSKFQEIVFGGVTRDIFQSMPLPVFMSH